MSCQLRELVRGCHELDWIVTFFFTDRFTYESIDFLGDLLSHLLSKSNIGVETCSNGSTALGQLRDIWNDVLDFPDVHSDLGLIARKLLSKGDGDRILGMGPSDLNDVSEFFFLLFQDISKEIQGWKEFGMEVHHH